MARKFNLLHESELLKNIIHSSMDGIICIDKEYRYVLWNKSMERISGMEANMVLGRISYEVFPFLKQTTGHDSYRRAMDGEVVVDESCLFDIPEVGKRGYFDSTYSPLRDESGAVVGVISVVHEVTDRLLAERAKKESELKYQSLTQYAHDAIISCDVSGEIRSWNHGAQEIFGYEETEIIGKSISSLIPDQFWRNYVKEIKIKLTRDVLVQHRRSSELLGNHKSGSSVPMDISLSGWKSDGMIFFSALIRDISTRKHFEALAEDRKNIYDVLLQGQSEMGMGMAILDSESNRIFYVNQEMCDLYGMTYEEMMKVEDLGKLVAPEMRELSLKRKNRRAKENLENDCFESVHVKKDGTRFFVQLSVTRCETNFGPSAIVLTRDITKSKKSELELIDQKRLNNQIMEWAHDVICTFSLDGTILTLSNSMERTTGWTCEEWIGRNILETVIPEDRHKVSEASKSIVEGKSLGSRVLRSQKKNGEIYFVETTRSPIINEGRVTGMIGIARDVTERVNYEKELEEEKLRFSTLAQATFEGIVITRDRIILEANQSYCKLFGYTSNEVIGMCTDSLAAPEDVAISRKYIDAKSEEIYKIRLQRKDKSIFYGEIRGKNIEYKGMPVRVAAIREIPFESKE
jgi:PAS domain S-box-containing protein